MDLSAIVGAFISYSTVYRWRLQWLPPSKDFGDLYSQTLLITVTSSRPEQASKGFIVNTMISDQGCSMVDPIIFDLAFLEWNFSVD
ncbi:hypothetical protein [Rosenbergiella nectarea]|uniref:hypothetical protein n=1 Tax=Rosenbergiella nectarea TaxID=988801 RepID=UPI001F4D78F1|nr:hypothetical protein [Rosenbergiella nectarea]